MEGAPFAEVGFLDETHGGENGADVVQPPLDGDLRLRAPCRRYIGADQRRRRIRQRDRALPGEPRPKSLSESDRTRCKTLLSGQARNLRLSQITEREWSNHYDRT